MTKLYELTGQIRELNELANDPEMAQAVQDTLEGLEMELQEKAEGILYLISNKNTDTDAIDAEIKRLTMRKKHITNFKDSLKEYLRTNMEASAIKKIETPLFTITLAAGRDICIIDDADDLPDAYVDVQMTAKPIKAEILKALKSGEELPGAHIEKSKTSIRIK